MGYDKKQARIRQRCFISLGVLGIDACCYTHRCVLVVYPLLFTVNWEALCVRIDSVLTITRQYHRNKDLPV